jgi:hypothetical protein
MGSERLYQMGQNIDQEDFSSADFLNSSFMGKFIQQPPKSQGEQS